MNFIKPSITSLFSADFGNRKSILMCYFCEFISTSESNIQEKKIKFSKNENVKNAGLC